MIDNTRALGLNFFSLEMISFCELVISEDDETEPVLVLLLANSDTTVHVPIEAFHTTLYILFIFPPVNLTPTFVKFCNQNS
ncbi:Uncharacterised protein [Acinetobacter baumannii]|nr:Uncharacterised protein [Acinetobacter baumannii]